MYEDLLNAYNKGLQLKEYMDKRRSKSEGDASALASAVKESAEPEGTVIPVGEKTMDMIKGMSKEDVAPMAETLAGSAASPSAEGMGMEAAMKILPKLMGGSQKESPQMSQVDIPAPIPIDMKVESNPRRFSKLKGMLGQ